MPREKSNLQGKSAERPSSREVQTATRTNVSNSFNPPPFSQSKSPLPAINSQNKVTSNSMEMSIHDETDLVLPTKVFQATKKSVRDLSQGLCSYLWFRRIKEIFLVMGKQNDAFTRFDTELARNDMIQTCEQYLENERPKVGGSKMSDAEQKNLDRWKNKRLYGETFRMSYFRKENESEEKSVKTLVPAELSTGEIPNFDNAIWWYSCNEAPIFDQMNNILRLENFELLMCHRYYISDLCQMIERSYAQDKFTQKQRVYRADKLSAVDFKTIQESITQKDARIAINGFISTSRNEKISLEYAANKLKKRNEDVVIMYEITIDPSIPCSAYADIQSISFHPREEEILFNMGSTFQIDSIEDDQANPEIKRIKLTARDFNLTLLDEMKAKVKQSPQATLSILLVRYLIELGEDRVNKRYLNQLIDSKQLENDPNLVAVYNCLGTIHLRQALYGEALAYYRKALNAQARLEFSNNNALAEIFNNIGQSHLGLNQLDEAKQNLEEGIRIQKREPKHAQQHLASLYCNLGQVAYAQRDWNEAETNFQLAHDLYKRNNKISHDALEKRLLLADLCIAFGHLKSVQNPKDSSEAHEKFKEALENYQCILPSSHPKVAEAHIEIICEYTRNKNFQAVIDYQTNDPQSLLNDYEMKATTSQMDLAHLYAHIGACYAHRKQFNEAMNIWKKSVEHEQKAFLDELLSSARVSKVQFQRHLVESAYRAAFEYYSSNKDNSSKEFLAILLSKMCAYEQVIETLRGESSFLLGHVCISQGKIKGSMVVYKRLLNEKNADFTLMIGLLLRMLTHKKITSNDEPIEELKRIDNFLAAKRTDNEGMRLRMIINDYLTENYLTMKNCDLARRHSQQSFALKQRLYSSHHPSMARNYQSIAACYFKENDFKTAAQYYEKAIEIQLENLPNGHEDIRSNYFLMADCYCRMDKRELASEFYDLAQAPNDTEMEEGTEVDLDVKAVLRMNSNLSEVFAKQEDFTSAINHQQMKIDVLKEILPTFVLNLIEVDRVNAMTFEQLQKIFETRLGLANGNIFAQVLRNLVFIHRCLARALLPSDGRTEDSKNATDLFENAIEIQLKLTLFENEREHNLADSYKELSDAYEKLYSSMKDTIQECLVNALEETTDVDQQRSLEFRLGNLCFEEDDYSEADRYWKNALKKVEDNPIAKAIIEKLIEKNQVNLLEENSEGEDEEQDTQDEEETLSRVQSAQSQRRTSVKSINEKEKPEELVRAYLYLNDDTAVMKHLQRNVSKLDELLEPTWSTEINLSSERLPMIKVFFFLLTEWINTNGSNSSRSKEDPKQLNWINRLQSDIQIFKIALRMLDSFGQLAKAVIGTYQTSKILYNIPEYFDQLFELLHSDLDNLQWDALASQISSNDLIKFFMAVAEYYFFTEDLSHALDIYRVLHDYAQGSEILKGAITYGISAILDTDIIAQEEHRPYIMSIDLQSSNLSIFDRLLLCRLTVAYMIEIEDEQGTAEFKQKLYQLQKQSWENLDFSTMNSIGQIFSQFEQNTLAGLYWEELRTLYNEILPISILNRLYDSESTFEQLYHAVEEINNDLFDNVRSLAGSYETKSIYEEKDQCLSDAKSSLEQAIVIYKKFDTVKAQQLQMKVNQFNDQNSEFH
ncbi:unnamed protein product [Rotaria sordida]|uniref:ADP ribosyltransferase domain-containing protein n=1 Tax=Rotaria sordida TaxID=392033 RepID=A0A814XJV2_9BILA|nr:unnamed protein product [Rotaria sordida]CAF1218979.1 unnamed protein product [Rotaria sordida]